MPDNAPDGLFDEASASLPTSAPTPASPGSAAAPETPTPAAQPRRADGTFAPRHPAYLVEDAREAFFSEEEIAQTPTEELGRLVRTARQAQRRLERDFTKQQSLEPQRQPQAVAAVPPPEDEGLPDLSHLDESVAETIRQTWRKAGRQEKELAELKQQAVRQQQQSIAERLDDAFASLPAAYLEYLGDGDFAGLPQAQKRRRNFLLEEAGINVYQLPSPRELKGKIQKAVTQHVKAKEAAEPARPAKAPDTGGYGKSAGTEPTEAQWLNGGVNRPSQRHSGDEPPGEARATANLRARMQERGLLPEQEKREIMDGFLQ